MAMIERVADGDEREDAPEDKTSERHKAAFGKKTIALVYDFDGTLSPRPMQDYAFLPQIGIDPEEFWKESNAIARREGAEKTTAPGRLGPTPQILSLRDRQCLQPQPSPWVCSCL
jgi:hypothetical protein